MFKVCVDIAGRLTYITEYAGQDILDPVMAQYVATTLELCGLDAWVVIDYSKEDGIEQNRE